MELHSKSGNIHLNIIKKNRRRISNPVSLQFSHLLFFFSCLSLYSFSNYLLLHTCPLEYAPNLKVNLVNDFFTDFTQLCSKIGILEIIIRFVQMKKKQDRWVGNGETGSALLLFCLCALFALIIRQFSFSYFFSKKRDSTWVVRVLECNGNGETSSFLKQTFKKRA